MQKGDIIRHKNTRAKLWRIVEKRKDGTWLVEEVIQPRTRVIERMHDYVLIERPQ
jgi:hypothetical protein